MLSDLSVACVVFTFRFSGMPATAAAAAGCGRLSADCIISGPGMNYRSGEMSSSRPPATADSRYSRKKLECNVHSTTEQ